MLAHAFLLSLASITAAVASQSASPNCDLLLARHLINPPRTCPTDSGPYAAMNKVRFLEGVLAHRQLTVECRSRPTSMDQEFILRLALRRMNRDHLLTRTSLVVRFVEESIRYDQSNGEVGRGSTRGESVRPLEVRFRFDWADGGSLHRFTQRRFHDLVVPELQATLDRLNDEAVQRFGRRLMARLEQAYPGEYESALAPEISPDELAMLIENLAL